MAKENITEKSDKDLHKELKEHRDELGALHLGKTEKNTARKGLLRKDIARIMTELKKRQANA